MIFIIYNTPFDHCECRLDMFEFDCKKNEIYFQDSTGCSHINSIDLLVIVSILTRNKIYSIIFNSNSVGLYFSWLCCYMAQMNPLIGPKLKNHVILVMAQQWVKKMHKFSNNLKISKDTRTLFNTWSTNNIFSFSQSICTSTI